VFIGRFDDETVVGSKGKERTLLPHFARFAGPAQATKTFMPARAGAEVNMATEAPHSLRISDAVRSMSFTGVRETTDAKMVVLLKVSSTPEETVYAVAPVNNTFTFTRDFDVKELTPDEVKKVWEEHVRRRNSQRPAYVPRNRTGGGDDDDDVEEVDLVEALATQTYRFVCVCAWCACGVCGVCAF
jgi:hypothetical protein